MSRIFVGNLKFAVNESALEAFIREFGIEVEKAQIVKDADGRSRGFGFVELSPGQDLKEAISLLDGRYLEGRGLTVNEARPRNGQRNARREPVRSDRELQEA